MARRVLCEYCCRGDLIWFTILKSLILIVHRHTPSIFSKFGPAMHELFLTASLGDDDRPRALQVLQGYCAMKPMEILRRRMFWTGPLARNNGFDPTFIASQGPRTPFWRLLNEQLVRQAYVVTVLYDVEREQFSKPETLPEERP